MKYWSISISLLCSGCSQEAYDRRAFWGPAIGWPRLLSSCIRYCPSRGGKQRCETMGESTPFLLRWLGGLIRFDTYFTFPFLPKVSFRYRKSHVRIFMQGSPDLEAAKEVAAYLGTIHHEFHFSVQVTEIFFIFLFPFFLNLCRRASYHDFGWVLPSLGWYWCHWGCYLPHRDVRCHDDKSKYADVPHVP